MNEIVEREPCASCQHFDHSTGSCLRNESTFIATMNRTCCSYLTLSSKKDVILNRVFNALFIGLNLNRVAFKGGFILKECVSTPRSTQDIDFSIDCAEAYNVCKQMFLEICTQLVNEGLIARFDIKPDIELKKSGGVSMYDSDGTCIASVDTSIAVLSYGINKLRLESKDIPVFSLERMAADKLCVIWSKKRFRRAKDLFDLYQIIKEHTLDYALISTCINGKGLSLDSDKDPTLKHIAVEYAKAYTKLNIVNYYTGDFISKPDFTDVLLLIHKFSLPFVSDLGVPYRQGTWIPDMQTWELE